MASTSTWDGVTTELERHNTEREPYQPSSRSPHAQNVGSESGTGHVNGNGSVDNLQSVDTFRTIGRFKLREKTDDLPQDWWFASTAIPLIAATIGPMANVLSIAALVSKWRDKLPNNGQLPDGSDASGEGIPDPHWVIVFNAISLACGFFGNFALLLNFTKRVRYIVALPLTIIGWYAATGILIGITVAMNQYVPPERPGQTYSQGFWHAILAAVMYLIGSMILMGNMLGYFLGHYPQHFDLDDDQRTLILQTMMFFFWLAGGAAVFSKVCGFSYADALYFCDVTVLTVGFGDIVANNTAGRGLIFPYSIIGIIFLGLMINSIRKFTVGMSIDNVVRKHQQRIRERTLGRSITSEKELRDRLGLPPRRESTGSLRLGGRRRPSFASRRESLSEYGRFHVRGRTRTFHEFKVPASGNGRGGASRVRRAQGHDEKLQERASRKADETKLAKRREKLILLKEEKDRFNAMREIQQKTTRFKQYFALSMSVFASGILWCIGALVFYYAEHREQDLTYFEALYFCYVSLLTIGYGDFSPRSNAGKPSFIVWSLVAIPTMTVLISDMSDTVVSAINRGTFTLADWTIMPKEGVWADFLHNHPTLKDWLERKTKEREEKKRIERGFTLQNPDTIDEEAQISDTEAPEEAPVRGKPSLEQLAEEDPEVTEHELARKLAQAIKRVANDLRSEHHKKYSYEEWVEYTRLIRFSRKSPKEVEEEEEDEGLVEWDWIGEDSPMLADVSESEWVLDRLCESLNRYTRRQAKKRTTSNKDHQSHPNIPQIPHHHPLTNTLHNTNIEHYPAHPGPRHPSQQRTVLARGPEGMMVVRAHSTPVPSHLPKSQSPILATFEANERGTESSGSGNGTSDSR